MLGCLEVQIICEKGYSVGVTTSRVNGQTCGRTGPSSSSKMNVIRI